MNRRFVAEIALIKLKEELAVRGRVVRLDL